MCNDLYWLGVKLKSDEVPVFPATYIPFSLPINVHFCGSLRIQHLGRERAEEKRSQYDKDMKKAKGVLEWYFQEK